MFLPSSPLMSGGLPAVFPIVFIIEDDEAASHSATVLLDSMGYVPRAFSSCEDFLATADRTTTGYLLLDYHFNGMSGLELLDTLREKGIFIPTILITGKFGGAIKQRAREYEEVVAVLDKPMKILSLSNALRNAATLARSRADIPRSP